MRLSVELMLLTVHPRHVLNSISIVDHRLVTENGRNLVAERPCAELEAWCRVIGEQWINRQKCGVAQKLLFYVCHAMRGFWLHHIVRDVKHTHFRQQTHRSEIRSLNEVKGELHVHQHRHPAFDYPCGASTCSSSNMAL